MIVALDAIMYPPLRNFREREKVMSNIKKVYCIVFAFVCASVTTAVSVAEESKLDTSKIEQLTGAKGKLDEKENVFKVSMPRSDLNVTAGGVKLTPPMGLTCWAAFRKMGDHTMVMGDQVLLEDQVNPVMTVALENGLGVTALLNHFFWESPSRWPWSRRPWVWAVVPIAARRTFESLPLRTRASTLTHVLLFYRKSRLRMRERDTVEDQRNIDEIFTDLPSGHARSLHAA
ncbi:MAG TPA: DUF1259 domain-containing protein [Tepidisphaeraceae bacterium]